MTLNVRSEACGCLFVRYEEMGYTRIVLGMQYTVYRLPVTILMDIFLIYFFDRFIYRISHFMRHWYVDSFSAYSRFVVARLEDMDQVIALKVTWRNMFQPLYQERNVAGYLFGFFFRLMRLLIGSVLYAIVITFAALLFLAWAAIIPYIIIKIAGQTPAGLIYKARI